jgi:hypothetical protein
MLSMSCTYKLARWQGLAHRWERFRGIGGVLKQSISAAGCAAVAVPAAAAAACQHHCVASCCHCAAARCSCNCCCSRHRCCGCVSRTSSCSAGSSSRGYRCNRRGCRHQCSGSCRRACIRCYQLSLAAASGSSPGNASGAARPHCAPACSSCPRGRSHRSCPHTESAPACSARGPSGAASAGAAAVTRPAVAVRCAAVTCQACIKRSCYTDRRYHQPSHQPAHVIVIVQPIRSISFGVGSRTEGLLGSKSIYSGQVMALFATGASVNWSAPPSAACPAATLTGRTAAGSRQLAGEGSASTAGSGAGASGGTSGGSGGSWMQQVLAGGGGGAYPGWHEATQVLLVTARACCFGAPLPDTDPTECALRLQAIGTRPASQPSAHLFVIKVVPHTSGSAVLCSW